MTESDHRPPAPDAPTVAPEPTPPATALGTPTTATPAKRIIRRNPLTPERLAKYVETLALTGSHFEACRVASPFPNEVNPGSEKFGGTTPPSCYSSFATERKFNPEFAQACDAAIQIAIGKAESEL